jgi:hypothetical protein
MLWCIFYIQDFFSLKKIKIQKIWWYFKVPQANCFWADFDKIWQFWAILGCFGQIQLALI